MLDTVTGIINFADINPGDAPSVKTSFDSFSYQNAQHIDVTATLNAQQLADIAAVEVKLSLVPDPGNNNNGSVAWTYSVADGAFDFLACRYSAHHWRDLDAGLRQARRVLRPNAAAVFIDAVSPGAPLLDTHLQAVELLRDTSHVRDYSVAEWTAAIH